MGTVREEQVLTEIVGAGVLVQPVKFSVPFRFPGVVRWKVRA